jgi:hypothetical protein
VGARGRRRLADLRVRLASFGIERDAGDFPFAPKVYAAAAAESLVHGQADLLVWMDSDSIVVQEPEELLLDAGSTLGFRPVDHTLISSPYDAPVDPFWAAIYRDCGISDEKLFPMTASVDQNRIRPYFNAGLLVARPERRLLRSWGDDFQRLFREPTFDGFYGKDSHYRIFLHQAVLAGTLLAAAKRDELQELSHLVSYPLHMHSRYPPDKRPATLNDAITCRYDVFFEDSGWREAITIREPLRGWLFEWMAGHAMNGPR